MGTGHTEIRGWLERGKAKGASHVIVVCDTFDWEDYPVFVMPTEDVREIEKQNNGPNMTKVMEVYKLDMDWDAQLKPGTRAFNY